MNSRFATLLSALLCLPALAQTAQGDSSKGGDAVAGELPERGLNHKRVESVFAQTNEAGEQVTVTNAYWQLEPGIHFLNEKGELQESKAIFEPQPGWAIANRMQHKVRLAANLNIEGHVDVLLPDGNQVISQVSALRYRDIASGKTVLLSGVKDSQAYIVGENQVVYTDAFEKISADVRYTITTSSFEQDILLHEAPPSPEVFGLNSDTTRLEVLTEFLKGPTMKAFEVDQRPPEKSLLPGEELSQIEREDVHFDLGTMKIGTGKAFSLNVDSASPIPVGKSWFEAEGRSFLVESVELRSAADQLNRLPKKAGGASIRKGHASGRQWMEARSSKLPSRRLAKVVKNLAPVPRATAVLANRLKEPLFALDYNSSLSGGTFTNITFQGDQTYYISGDCSLTGTTTFEGGAVIKYFSFPANWPYGTPEANLWISGPVVCNTSVYRPAVFTGRDDDSIGAIISTSTHSMAGTLYGPRAIAFWSYGSPIDLHDMRFVSMIKGICFDYCSDKRVRNMQFVNRSGAYNSGIEFVGKNGTTPPTNAAYVGNVLFSAMGSAFYGAASNGLPAIGDVLLEHCTFDRNYYNVLLRYWEGYNAMTFRNCLVGPCDSSVASNDATSITNRLTEITNRSSIFIDSSATWSSTVISSYGGGAYLPSGSAYINAGDASIDSALSTDSRDMTTLAPTAVSGSVADGTVLAPIVARDSDTPDVGYHYPAFDYIAVSGASINNATVVMTNGVAVGWYGSSAFSLQNGGALISQGTPTRLNRLLHYTLFQESVPGSTPSSVFAVPTNNTTAPSLYLRFTELSSLAGKNNLILPAASGTGDPAVTPMTFKDSQIHAMFFQYVPNSGYGRTLTFANNLFNRGLISIHAGLAGNAGLNLSMWNNTFYRMKSPDSGANQFALTYITGQAGWTLIDNVFDGTTISTSGTIAGTMDYNAFAGGTPVGSGTHNNTSIVTYATGSLGSWYQSSTNYYNAGSRTGGAAGLYHCTTKTNQQKQLNSTVDLGFHYVATIGSGVTLAANDDDSDGFPDYLEDANGDGDVSSGETDWTTPTDLGLRVWIAEPKPNVAVP